MSDTPSAQCNGRKETKELGGHLFPYSQDLSILSEPVTIKGENVTLKNPLVIQPLEGADSAPNGAPTEYTYRRYRRYLGSGAGLVWFESLAVTEDGRSYPSAAWINEGNVGEYERFISELKAEFPDAKIIAQLTHAGRFSKPKGTAEPIIATYNPHHNGRQKVDPDHPVATDEYLDQLTGEFVRGALLCKQAGFDGVDVKGCHGYLFSDLLCAFNREGRYGGSFENRSRMLLQTIKAVKDATDPGFIVATRICYGDTTPFPYGFGMKTDGSLEYDPTETIQLVNELHALGVNLINVSVGRVTVNPKHTDLAEIPVDSGEDYFNRFYQGTKVLSQACPDVTFVGSCYTQMKADGPHIAAAALENGEVGLIGFGRQANACPEFIHDLATGEAGEGNANGRKLCTLCGNCYKLLRSGTPTGCPTRDKEMFLPLLLKVLEK